MKDALTPCSLPGKELICIQFIAKVGIPSPLASCPWLGAAVSKVGFLLCSANANGLVFLIVRQKPREREGEESAALALSPGRLETWKRDRD